MLCLLVCIASLCSVFDIFQNCVLVCVLHVGVLYIIFFISDLLFEFINNFIEFISDFIVTC